MTANDPAVLSTLLEQASDVILLLDRTGVIRFASASAERIVGDSDDLTGRAAFDLVHPDDRADARAAFERAAASPGEVVPAEVRLQHAGGWRTVAVTVVNRLDRPEVGAVVVTARNVTALRRTEAAFVRLFTTAPVGIYQSTPDGRILVANPRLAEMLGYDSPEEVEAVDMRALYVRPEEREEIIRSWERSGAPAADLEVRWKRRDGSPIWIHMTAHAVHDASGRTRYFQGFVRDVTGERDVRNRLSESEERYRGLVEHSPDAIAVHQDGVIQFVNRAAVELLGAVAPRDLVGRQVLDFLHPDDRPRVQRRVRDMERGRVAPPLEERFRRLDGGVVHVEVIGIPVTFRGRPAVQVVARDITDRRAADEALRQAQKMEAVGQLTGGIAHDFNNLLTVILANAEMLRDDLDPASHVREVLDDVRGAARRGQAMVRKLLGFARKTALDLRTVDVGGIIAEAATMLARMVPEDIRLEPAIPDRLPPVRADAGAVEQILINLVTNARDAMPAGGTLGIDVTHRVIRHDVPADPSDEVPAGEYVEVAVRDSGTGMDDETRRRIFEPFFTTKPVGVGTGLGLSMVYGLVRQHDGYVQLESRAGRGTTMRILLPVDAQTELDFGGESRAGDAVPRGNETILLAEDEPEVRRATERALKRFGYRVLSASDGQDALERFRADPDAIDIIVSDVVMPRMGGKALYDAVRADGSRVPFLFASGYTARDPRASVILEQHLPLLHKPWTIPDLLQAVRRVLDGER